MLPVFPEEVRAWFDRVGPVFAMATTVAAVVLAVLGAHRPVLAGTLLVVVALFVFVQLVVAADALHEGPGPLSLLGTSGGVMLVPMVVSGVLLLVGHQLGQPRRGHRTGVRHRPAHA